jgi:hypothetical protein
VGVWEKADIQAKQRKKTSKQLSIYLRDSWWLLHISNGFKGSISVILINIRKMKQQI